MLEKFDTLFEQVYNTVTKAGLPVAYTLPDILTEQECEELTSYLESNLKIAQNIRDFLTQHPRPADKHPEWVKLWNDIFENAYNQKQLTSIVQYQNDPKNPGRMTLSPNSLPKCEGIRDHVLNRLSGGLLKDASQPFGTTNRSETLLQRYDRWLSRVAPDNHLSYDGWTQRQFKI